MKILTALILFASASTALASDCVPGFSPVWEEQMTRAKLRFVKDLIWYEGKYRPYRRFRLAGINRRFNNQLEFV